MKRSLEPIIISSYSNYKQRILGLQSLKFEFTWKEDSFEALESRDFAYSVCDITGRVLCKEFPRTPLTFNPHLRCCLPKPVLRARHESFVGESHKSKKTKKSGRHRTNDSHYLMVGVNDAGSRAQYIPCYIITAIKISLVGYPDFEMVGQAGSRVVAP